MNSLLPTERDVSFFHENGYWIAPKIVSDERLERLREHMDLVYDGKFETGREPVMYWKKEDGDVLRKFDNAHWSDHVFRSMVTDETIGKIAARLMNADIIRLWQDQLLYKPGNGDKTVNVGWHQDYNYWQCAAEPTLLTAWVAFDDVDILNGCMQVIPHSNTWGLMDKSDFFQQDIKSQEKNMRIPEGEIFKKVPLVMKAGQVSFHHALTLHGSGPNTTNHPRRSIAIHLMTGDTRYRAGTSSDVHINVSILHGKDGDLFQGEGFPVVYDNSTSQYNEP